MELVQFLIAVLATYRITNLFVDDDEGGPWDILHIIRYHVGYRYDEDRRAYGTTLVSRAMICFWCFSFWAGIFVLLVLLIPYNIGLYLLAPFALSAGALITKHIVEK